MTIEEVGKQVVIAHNDPSPTRDRVLRAYERRRTSINIQISLPSLDGIKRAVEMGIGVALLPRRCALTEIARGHLVAVKVPELGATRQVRLASVYRRTTPAKLARRDVGSASSRCVKEPPRDVRQARRDGPHVVVVLEQQTGRVPTAVEKRFARRGRQRRSVGLPGRGDAHRRQIDDQLRRTDPARPTAIRACSVSA